MFPPLSLNVYHFYMNPLTKRRLTVEELARVLAEAKSNQAEVVASIAASTPVRVVVDEIGIIRRYTHRAEQHKVVYYSD